MRFTCQKDSLLESLGRLANASVMSAQDKPLILVKSSTTEKRVEFRANSHIMSGMTYFTNEVVVEASGKLCVYGNVLFPIAASLSQSGEDEVHLFTDDNGILHIESGITKYKIGTISASLFPFRDEESPMNRVLVLAEEFTDAIKRTHYAVNKRLNCVRLEITDRKLIASATDTTRMPVRAVDVESDLDTELIVHADAIYKLSKYVSFSKTGDFHLSWSPNQAVIEFDNYEFRTPLFNVKFPDWRMLEKMTEAYDHVATFNGPDMRRIMTGTVIFGGNVKIDLTRDNMHVSMENEAVGTGNWDVPCEYKHPDTSLILGHSVLIDFFKYMMTGDVYMRLANSTSPVVFTGEEYPGLTYYAMPIKL